MLLQRYFVFFHKRILQFLKTPLSISTTGTRTTSTPLERAPKTAKVWLREITFPLSSVTLLAPHMMTSGLRMRRGLAVSSSQISIASPVYLLLCSPTTPQMRHSKWNHKRGIQSWVCILL
ncbi:unnamed protein product [Calypogeia fissa]